MKSRLLVSLGLALLMLTLVVWLPDGGAHAAGEIIKWASAQSGNWNEASKWDLGHVPGPSDRVFIDALDTNDYTITLSDDVTVAALTINSSQATFVVAAEKTLTITGDNSVFDNLNCKETKLNGNLELTGPNSTSTMNGGELDINGGFKVSNGTFNYNGGTLSGTPTLVLENSTLNLGGAILRRSSRCWATAL